MSRRRSPDGFTLLEVLVSIFLLGIIMTFIYGTYATSAATKEAVEDRLDVSRAGRQILAVMTRELESAYVTDQDARGDFSRQPMTIFQGSRDEFDGRPMNHLLFTTLAHVFIPSANEEDNDYQSDHAEIEYTWQQDPETLEVRLLHRENPALDYVPSQGGVTYELYDRVRSFQVRYWDGSTWVDEWDSTGRGANALPYAADIRLVLASEGGVEVAFGALVRIALAEAPPQLGPTGPGATPPAALPPGLPAPIPPIAIPQINRGFVPPGP